VLFTSAELASWIGGLLWPLTRIGALLSVAPMFSARVLPRRVRAALALALTVAVLPLLPPAPAIEPFSADGVIVLIQQLLIGLFMGLVLRLVFAALETAGQVVATQMGLGFASLVDPINGGQMPLLSQFYSMFGMLIFLALDGHLVLIRMLVDSFRALPVGTDGLSLVRYRELAEAGVRIFAGALSVGLPAIASLMVVNLAFGVMSRAAPQLNIFAVGLPITLIFGLLILLFSLPALAPEVARMLDEGYRQIAGMLRAGG